MMSSQDDRDVLSKWQRDVAISAVVTLFFNVGMRIYIDAEGLGSVGAPFLMQLTSTAALSLPFLFNERLCFSILMSLYAQLRQQGIAQDFSYIELPYSVCFLVLLFARGCHASLPKVFRIGLWLEFFLLTLADAGSQYCSNIQAGIDAKVPWLPKATFFVNVLATTLLFGLYQLKRFRNSAISFVLNCLLRFSISAGLFTLLKYQQANIITKSVADNLRDLNKAVMSMTRLTEGRSYQEKRDYTFQLITEIETSLNKLPFLKAFQSFRQDVRESLHTVKRALEATDALVRSFKELLLDIDFEVEGTVSTVFDAKLILVGENHTEVLHKLLAKYVYTYFNNDANCLFLEGAQYAALEPCPELKFFGSVSRMRCTGWDDKLHPFWKAWDDLRVTYDELIRLEKQLFSPVITLGELKNLSFPSQGVFMGMKRFQLNKSKLRHLITDAYALKKQVKLMREAFLVVAEKFKNFMAENKALSLAADNDAGGKVAWCKYYTFVMTSYMRFLPDTYGQLFHDFDLQTDSIEHIVSLSDRDCLAATSVPGTFETLKSFRAIILRIIHEYTRGPVLSVFAQINDLFYVLSRQLKTFSSYSEYILAGRNKLIVEAVQKNFEKCERIFVHGGHAHFFSKQAGELREAIKDVPHMCLKPR